VTRHTVSYEILETYKVGEQPSIDATGRVAGQRAAQ
jgi:sarcosine oxidase subunit delta